MQDRFDPYQQWLGIPVAEQPPHHYRLLGLPPFTDDRAAISRAVQSRIAQVRLADAGRQPELVQRLVAELTLARQTLLDPPRKLTYDAILRGARVSRAAAQPAPSGTRVDQPPVTLVTAGVAAGANGACAGQRRRPRRLCGAGRNPGGPAARGARRHSGATSCCSASSKRNPGGRATCGTRHGPLYRDRGGGRGCHRFGSDPLFGIDAAGRRAEPVDYPSKNISWCGRPACPSSRDGCTTRTPRATGGWSTRVSCSTGRQAASGTRAKGGR